jgi:hypothetical protein
MTELTRQHSNLGAMMSVMSDQVAHKPCRIRFEALCYSPIQCAPSLGRAFLQDSSSFEDLLEGDYRRHSPRFQGENFEKKP